MTESKPKRRWIRFSLRTLMILVTVICVLFGAAMLWYRAENAEYKRQLQIAESIGNYCVKWQSHVPGWLNWLPDQKRYLRIVEYDYGHRVGIHAVPGREAPPYLLAAIEQLQQVPTLHSLTIHEHFLDAGLVSRIQKLHQLETITIVFWVSYKHDWDKTDHLIKPQNFVDARNDQANYNILSKSNVEFTNAVNAIITEINQQLPHTTIKPEIVFMAEG